MMTIFYKLQPCSLPGGRKKFRARVSYNGVYTMEDMLDLLDSHSVGVSRAILLAVFEEIHLLLVRMLLDGHKIETPIGTVGLKIKGYFPGDDARFTKDNSLEITIVPTERLTKAVVSKAKIRKKPSTVPKPDLQIYTNLAQPDSKNILTPGHMARVSGYELKFDAQDPKQGIFLRPIKNGNRSLPAGPSVRIEEIGLNTDRQLIFQVPADLPVGMYVLEIKSLFGTASMRAGEFDDLLIVP
ncbi:MAG: DUF4469 domain-containing protein [Anaerolineae bacterium]|nr:DUF4469 domain-containing protein [Anaerolineae bacterium]